jgi:hypothetical protein
MTQRYVSVVGDLITNTIIAEDPPAGYVLEATARAAGAKTESEHALAPVPTSVSRLQAILALHAAGLLTPIETLVAASSAEVQLAWANTPDFHRVSPMVGQLWAALGQTEAALDNLFRTAAGINP